MQPSTQEHTIEQIISWTYRADSVTKCSVRDVIQMRDGSTGFGHPGFYWLGTRPCRTVEIVGVVVALQDYEKRTLYSLDDGSAVVECVLRHHPSSSLPALEVGDTVRCLGKVGQWHEARQVNLDKIEVCHDPTDEPRHWKAVSELHKTVYMEPFVLPELPELPFPATPTRKTGELSVPQSGSSTLASSSAASSPSKPSSPNKLRHPSKLRSSELTDNTFRIYVKHWMVSVLSEPPHSPAFHDPFSTPTKHVPLDFDRTPRPCHRSNVPLADVTGCQAMANGCGRISSKDRARRGKADNEEPPGFTLSYLRRVPELAELGHLVVRAEARRRDKEQRRKERELSKSQQARGDSQPQRTTATAGSSRQSSRGQVGEREGEKVKRLFAWAVRTLRAEGEVVLAFASARRWEQDRALHRSAIWSSASEKSSVTMTTEPTLSAPLEPPSTLPPPSPPPSNEESYLPITSSLLREPVLQALQHCLSRRGVRKTGASIEDIVQRLHRDERWEHIGEWDVGEAMNSLKGERVQSRGVGKWDFM